MHLYKKITGYILLSALISFGAHAMEQAFAMAEPCMNQPFSVNDVSFQMQEQLNVIEQNTPQQNELLEVTKEALHKYVRENQFTKQSGSINASVEHGLSLSIDSSHNRAMAVFEIPDQHELYHLTDQEAENAQQIFEVYHGETIGDYKSVSFNYTDETVLPDTREQALFLLYCPYLSDIPRREQLDEQQLTDYIAREKHPLSEQQESIIHPKKVEQRTHTTSTQEHKEGFFRETLIKTPQGYSQLGNIRVGDTVSCFDFEHKQQTFKMVTYVDTVHLSKHMQVRINDDILHVAPDHQFYVPSQDRWATVQEMKNSPDLMKASNLNLQEINEVNAELDVTRITVDGTHNFYVTKHDILVHNFVFVIDIVFELGAIIETISATWSVVGPTLTAAGTAAVGYFGYKTFYKSNPSDSPPASPTRESNKRNNKKNNDGKKRDAAQLAGQKAVDEAKKRIKIQQALTNQEARELAKQHGYKEVKVDFYTHGKPTFQKGNKIISPDRDGHNGGVWKEFNARTHQRTGTLNKDLKPFKD